MQNYFFTIVLILLNTLLFSQKSISIIKKIKDQCGSSVELEAKGALGNYTWSDANIQGYGEMSVKEGPITALDFTKNGIYTVEVTADVFEDEIAIDGGFDAFDKDNLLFETSYAYPTSSEWGVRPGEYWVDDEVFAYSASFCESNPNLKKRIDPITGQISDRGNFMLFDAANPAGAANTAAIGRSDPMWKLVNQSVKPGTDYTFSVDVLPWPASESVNMMLLVAGNTDAQAEPIPVTIDGLGSLVAGGTVAKVTGGCNWSIVSGTWNSGTNTSVTFMVSEVGSFGPGHEGAIDNVSFSTRVVTRETAAIEVDVDLPLPDQIDYCIDGGTVDLEIGDGEKWRWCEDDACVAEIGIEDGAPVPLPESLKVEGDSYVFLQNKSRLSLGLTGPPSTLYSSNSVDVNSYTAFSATEVIYLNFVKMKAPAWEGTVNGTVELFEVLTNTVIAEKEVAVSGLTIVDLGFLIAPGDYRLIFRGSGVSTIPYSFNEQLYSLGSSVQITDYEAYFAGKKAFSRGVFSDLFFESGRLCAPVPVKLVGSECCTQLPATIAVKSGTASTCVGSNLELEATPNFLTRGPIEYQWYNALGPLPDATLNSYVVPTIGSSGALSYWVTVTNSGDCVSESPKSNVVDISVLENLVGTITTDCSNTAPDPFYELVVAINQGSASAFHFTTTGVGVSDITWSEVSGGVFRSIPIEDGVVADVSIINPNGCGGLLEVGLIGSCGVTTSFGGSGYTKSIVYPTIVESSFKVKGDGVDLVAVFNQEGALVKTYNNEEKSYNVTELSAGIYLVKIWSGDHSFTTSIIKK